MKLTAVLLFTLFAIQAFAQNKTMEQLEKEFQGIFADFNSTNSTVYEYDAIVPPDGNLAVSGSFSWITNKLGVDFIAAKIVLTSSPALLTGGASTLLYFQIQDPEYQITSLRLLQANKTNYEGIATTFTLKSDKEKLLTIAASNNMWGDRVIDSNEKAVFTKFNSAQSTATSNTSVWRRGPNELQTYEAPASSDGFGKATVTTWRLVNDATHFKIQGGQSYYFKVGYRLYKSGTNTSTGVASGQADTALLSFRFDVDGARELCVAVWAVAIASVSLLI